MTKEKLEALAKEINKRRLKFADLPSGRYEMLSGEEHQAVVAALSGTVVSQEYLKLIYGLLIECENHMPITGSNFDDDIIAAIKQTRELVQENKSV